jgi:DNA-binding LytR/AlgR family response regulator
MVRLLGGNYERQLKLKIERLSKEVLSQSKLNKDLFAYKTRIELNKGINDKKTSALPTSKKRILTYSRNELVPMEIEEIAHIYTENTVTYVKSIDGKTSNCNSSLDELYNKLDSSLFFRANRQFILSIKAIDKILRYGNSQLKIEVIPRSSADIIISKNRAAEFKSWLNR